LVTRMQQRPEWAELLWFLLLVLSLGVVFGWHFAAMLLVLWLIGYYVTVAGLFGAADSPCQPRERAPTAQMKKLGLRANT
jgi:hypothetical protein